MKRGAVTDPYFADQPEKRFIEELKSPLWQERPDDFDTAGQNDGEADIHGIYLKQDDMVPETIAEDFAAFTKIYGIAGKRYPIVVNTADMNFEEHEIEITESEICIRAADAEGVRRAVVWIEDEIRRRNAGFLKKGCTKRNPWLKTRLTRCFFSPINRPPKFGDELSDDIDYYPEEYLNRLMHDGVNAVWIYTRFSDLVPSDYVSSYGKGGEARIEKLNRVCEKCMRYGIRPFVFAIEPVALTEEDMRELGSDGGGAYNGRHLCCVNTERGRAFVKQLGQRLFTECPNLGGFISITYGERPTSCVSSYQSIPEIRLHHGILCPRCKDLTPGQATANAAKALAEGIHAANPDAVVVSWTYGHRFQTLDDAREYVRRMPDDIKLMQNFEEMGYAEQLGQKRQGVDYWLSYAGPSPLYRATAEEAKKEDKPMFFKTQVCCCHELATVPYIPAPGLVLEKYRNAMDLGAEGVMQCWYFGNYPSLMSKAAGELSFENEIADADFEKKLAALYWTEADRAAQAWKLFGEAYRKCPLNIMFSYYGPLHDGPVWKLQLKPKNYPLPRSWQTVDPADGDRIGECLLWGHTLDEALTLLTDMREKWQEGLKLLESLHVRSSDGEEQLSVARAISVLIRSACNILTFYREREKLGRGDENAQALLNSMRKLLLDEIENSSELIGLCEKDGRLGYHSEGEGYKFFPKKLRDRIEYLHTLLDTEFAEVQKRIEDGLSPLEYYDGIEEGVGGIDIKAQPIEAAEWVSVGKGAFRMAYSESRLTIEAKGKDVVLDPEFALMHPYPTVEVRNGEFVVSSNDYLYYSVFGEKLEKFRNTWHIGEKDGVVRLTADRKDIGWEKDRPFKLRVEIDGELWQSEENPVKTLGKNNVSPGEYGWIRIPVNK